MTSNDQNKRGNYPLMKMPRRDVPTSGFEERFAELNGFILQHVYPFFMWYGSITKSHNDEVRSILFLEGLFLQMLTFIRGIFEKRGKKLCNEHASQFKDILTELNEKMRKGTKFIHLSNRCLQDELNTEASCAAAMRQDVVAGFRDLSGWLHEELHRPGNRERAEALADELGLNYNMSQYGCIGDSFEQHTNMVLNGLMLLAMPLMPDTLTEDYSRLFDNSIAEMQANRSVKWAFESWRKKIEKEYELNSIVEDHNKVVYLKDLWKVVDEQEQTFLDGFGIVADNTRSVAERATMGFRIYEHLNADTFDNAPCMTSNDLRQYLLYVIQKQFLDDEIDRLKPPPPGRKKGNNRRLFKQKVDQRHLVACMSEVYNRFYIVKDKVKLEGRYNDLMAVIVYLYIICDMEGYFENADKVPFFEFCKEKAGFVTDKTDRTFRNRFDQLDDVYKKYCLKGSNKLQEATENDFLKVMRIFHGKVNYEKLRQGMMV